MSFHKNPSKKIFLSKKAVALPLILWYIKTRNKELLWILLE